MGEHSDNERRLQVVIIGAGFGGLSAARALRKAPVDIQLVDKRNYHLFQPLLYQVATADLSPANIAWPVRGIFNRQRNLTVKLSKVIDVDTTARKVILEDLELPYDHLIVAIGSSHSYFGQDQWAQHAPGLKSLVDATRARRNILMAFERAEIASTEAERNRQLTFIVVGAGPTGVEMAGAIAELAHTTLTRDFRNIRSIKARVLLIEAGARVLSAFPESLSAKAQRSLEQLGVDVLTDTRVEDISAEHVVANGETIPTATTLWAAGVQVEGVADWLGVEPDRAGRIVVGDDLTVPGLADVSVIGDAAKVAWRDDLDVPGIAPAAKQEGKYVGKRLTALARGAAAPAPFRYRHMGSLATIGRHSAVISYGRFKLSGLLAWLLWGAAHIYFLIGVQRPLMVAINWVSSYVFQAKGARLIVGMDKLRKQQEQQTDS